MARYRNVCFTLNNPTESITFDAAKMLYLVWQEELSASGTYHFQGYCEFKEQTGMAAAKDLLGGATVHLEGRRGSQAQAIAYVKKEDTRLDGPYEEGTPREQGKRVDLELFKSEVLSGAKKRDLVADHYATLARYPKFYDTLTMMTRPTRQEELVVTLLIGDTGLGKTRSVMDELGQDEEFYIAPLNNGTQWWDGLDGQTKILLDDFTGAASHLPLCSLLRMLDRYPLQVATKGGHTWWLPNEIYITTNILPKHWYKWENRGEQYKALARRFAKVKAFFGPGQFTEREGDWWEINAPSEAIY